MAALPVALWAEVDSFLTHTWSRRLLRCAKKLQPLAALHLAEVRAVMVRCAKGGGPAGFCCQCWAVHDWSAYSRPRHYDQFDDDHQHGRCKPPPYVSRFGATTISPSYRFELERMQPYWCVWERVGAAAGECWMPPDTPEAWAEAAAGTGPKRSSVAKRLLLPLCEADWKTLVLEWFLKRDSYADREYWMSLLVAEALRRVASRIQECRRSGSRALVGWLPGLLDEKDDAFADQECVLRCAEHRYLCGDVDQPPPTDGSPRFSEGFRVRTLWDVFRLRNAAFVQGARAIHLQDEFYVRDVDVDGSSDKTFCSACTARLGGWCRREQRSPAECAGDVRINFYIAWDDVWTDSEAASDASDASDVSQ